MTHSDPKALVTDSFVHIPAYTSTVVEMCESRDDQSVTGRPEHVLLVNREWFEGSHEGKVQYLKQCFHSPTDMTPSTMISHAS